MTTAGGGVTLTHMDVIQSEADLDRQRRRLRLLAALADARAKAKRRTQVPYAARIRELVAVRRRLTD